jgi:hypothetical protein
LLLLHVRTRTTLSVWKLAHRFVRAPLATSWMPQLFPMLWLGPVTTEQSPQTMFHCRKFRNNRYRGASDTYDGCPACGCKEAGAVIVTGHVDRLGIFAGQCEATRGTGSVRSEDLVYVWRGGTNLWGNRMLVSTDSL